MEKNKNKQNNMCVKRDYKKVTKIIFFVCFVTKKWILSQLWEWGPKNKWDNLFQVNGNKNNKNVTECLAVVGVGGTYVGLNM